MDLRMPASEAFLHHPPASALTCSSAARFGAYSNEAPQFTHFASPISSSSSSPSSSIFSTTYSASLLPLAPTAPALYTGRWEVKTSNELSDELGCFVTVEIDENGCFRAIGHRKYEKGLMSWTSKVSRSGSFSLQGIASSFSPSEAATTTASTVTTITTRELTSRMSSGGSGEQPPEGDRVVGTLTFEADQAEEISSSLGGVGLPQSFLKRPLDVRDLGGKQREVLVTVVSMDTIILLFVERSKFYVLTRSTASSNSTDVQVPMPLNAMLVTQIFSMVATAVAEALRSDLMHFIK